MEDKTKTEFEKLGFVIDTTGGGGMAYCYYMADDSTILVTDLDGCHLPEGDDPVVVGVHDRTCYESHCSGPLDLAHALELAKTHIAHGPYEETEE